MGDMSEKEEVDRVMNLSTPFHAWNVPLIGLCWLTQRAEMAAISLLDMITGPFHAQIPLIQGL
jgi:hypothetical protein